jgi:hypothetical protein
MQGSHNPRGADAGQSQPRGVDAWQSQPPGGGCKAQSQPRRADAEQSQPPGGGCGAQSRPRRADASGHGQRLDERQDTDTATDTTDTTGQCKSRTTRERTKPMMLMKST